MVLQANVTSAGMFLISDVKLVLRAVRTLVRLGELVEISARDQFIVEHHFNEILVGGDVDVVPLADGLHRVAGGLGKIVKSAGIVEARARGIIDGDFNSVETNVFSWPRSEGSRANKDSAVTAFADFEIE